METYDNSYFFLTQLYWEEIFVGIQCESMIGEKWAPDPLDSRFRSHPAQVLTLVPIRGGAEARMPLGMRSLSGREGCTNENNVKKSRTLL